MLRFYMVMISNTARSSTCRDRRDRQTYESHSESQMRLLLQRRISGGKPNEKASLVSSHSTVASWSILKCFMLKMDALLLTRQEYRKLRPIRSGEDNFSKKGGAAITLSSDVKRVPKWNYFLLHTLFSGIFDMERNSWEGRANLIG